MGCKTTKVAKKAKRLEWKRLGAKRLVTAKITEISAMADFSQLTIYSKIVRSSGHLSCG